MYTSHLVGSQLVCIKYNIVQLKNVRKCSKNVRFLQNIQKRKASIVKNIYVEKIKSIKKYLKTRKNGESVQSNKNQKNVRYCSKTNIFGFDVHIISW